MCLLFVLHKEGRKRKWHFIKREYLVIDILKERERYKQGKVSKEV